MSHKKMNPEVKKVWINELRSGRYKQKVGRLHSAGGFCCLGVLCDLSGAAKWQDGKYIDSVCMPPSVVEGWANLGAGAREYLIQLNDEKGASFAEIADWIERHL